MLPISWSNILKMQALVSTRFLLLGGDHLPVGKLLHVSRFHGSVHFLSRIDREHGPLTLASLGFRSEFETTKGNKTKLLQLNSVPKVTKN